ncbi:helix-turn-helix domain-containing protein [Halomonas sp. LBP4]|uniref:helix-turn-helix domain-containing protein n=1 Tax=Halomonas sp. LBP4 TaxID=2044917 RepID=UPI000D75ECB5|nr:helix-turn-helix domain-containing protein [Halomonas sp. LBP4]PXX99687.1 hypothetical protein CR157_02645 [Halomonas sp. LBP4]
MSNTIHLASALMGSGKTQSMINGIESDDCIIVAAPKKELCREIFKSFKSQRQDLDVDLVNSDTVCSGSTVLCEAIDAINKVNTDTEYAESFGMSGSVGKVLILTQATLVNLPPDILRGQSWTLILDEVPDIKASAYMFIFKDQFERNFSDHVYMVDTKTGRLELKDGMEFDAKDQLSKAKATDFSHAVLMFEGLIHETSEVSLEPKSNGRQVLKSVGYHDFSPVFRAAKEVHVMGNAIEKSLFYLFLKAKGFRFDESKFTPKFDGYKMSPRLVPLLSGDRFSKTMMLTREKDGSKSDTFDTSTVGWQMLKRAIEYHEGKPLLVHIYKWMKPFFKANTYPNVVVVDLDSRGLNQHRHLNRTVHMIHGNAAPVDSQMNKRMLELMGVDVQEGLQALRHERLVEKISQTMLRTDMRNLDEQKYQTVSVIPTMGLVGAVRDNLKIDCEVDTSIMIDPPEPSEKSQPSHKQQAERQANREASEARRMKAVKLLKEGHTISAVSRAVPADRKTIRKWWAQEVQAA